MTFDMKKDEGSVNGSKRYHLALSRRGMLGLGAGAVVCLAWVFILGVLVGRGYQPEKQVPELATLMPASKNATAEMTHDKEKNKVIKAEDLDYYANLKEQPRSKGVTESSKTESSAEKKQQEPARELTAPAKAEPKKQAESEELKTIVPASPKATEAMTASKNQEKQEAPKQAAAPAKPKETVKPKETAKATTPAPAAKTAQVRPGMDAPVSTTKNCRSRQRGHTSVRLCLSDCFLAGSQRGLAFQEQGEQAWPQGRGDRCQKQFQGLAPGGGPFSRHAGRNSRHEGKARAGWS